MSRPPYLRLPYRHTTRPGADDLVQLVVSEHAAGRLPEGARLPPVRVLEHQLGISKNTVQSAYDELCARGVLEARPREGVFVKAAATPRAPGWSAESLAPTPRLRDLALAPQERPTGKLIHLSNVFVDPELLPRDKLTDCFRSVLAQPGLHTFYDGRGYPPLREAIARRLRARGMPADPDHVVITSGSQQALDVVARALTTPRIAIEDPVYRYARILFESLGVQLTGLPLDPFGDVDVDDWAARLRNARPSLMYTITSFQNPTGRSYSTHELEQLLRLARDLGFALFEDDWGSDMLSETDYRPTLRALGGDTVLYANSFTKKLLPALRIGFVVGNADSAPVLEGVKRLSTLGNATLLEATLHEFLDRGYYDTHLARVQRALDERYRACLEALRELMPEGVRWTTPGGGPTLWLELPSEVKLAPLAERLLARGVEVQLMPRAFSGPRHLNGFPIGYAFNPPEVLRRALGIVAEELG